MFQIEVDDSEVQSVLNVLASRISNMRPYMQAIGEDVMERTKQRFDSSSGPDGQRWKPNARATIEAWIRSKSRDDDAPRTHNGRQVAVKNGYLLKDGRVGSKSILQILGKRPLIANGDLASYFNIVFDSQSVSVNNNWMAEKIKGGAAVHQFGSKNGRIPARPFFPITQDGSWYPDEKARVIASLNAYLIGG